MLRNDNYFNDFLDFYEKRKEIKKEYQIKSLKGKKEYKEKIYNLNMSQFELDIIWEYLNEPMGSNYYIYDKKMQKYLKERKGKNEKIKK